MWDGSLSCSGVVCLWTRYRLGAEDDRRLTPVEEEDDRGRGLDGEEEKYTGSQVFDSSSDKGVDEVDSVTRTAADELDPIS